MICNHSTAWPYFASDWGIDKFSAMATAIGAEAVQAPGVGNGLFCK